MSKLKRTFILMFERKCCVHDRLLQQENEDLKESLKEHQSVLEFIMAKYREQMLKLIQLKKEQELTENFYKTTLNQTLQDKIDKIAEMTEVMRKAVQLDDAAANKYEERVKMLEMENEGLKELLKIKATFDLPINDDNL